MSRKTHALGQHMLIDNAIIDYETAMARPDGKCVLEIGGGTGNLTEALARKAAKVITIEKDPELVVQLRSRFRTGRKVKVIVGDFLEMNQKDIEKAAKKKIDVIASNVPYSISSPLLFRLLEWRFDHALLCFQKEFALRMVAQPETPEYSRLSVMAQLYFKTILLRLVKRAAFRPVPEVDSAIVFLTKRETPIDKKRDELIRMLFTHKNKTLKAALKAREFEDFGKEMLERAKERAMENKRIFQLTLQEITVLVS